MSLISKSNSQRLRNARSARISRCRTEDRATEAVGGHPEITPEPGAVKHAGIR
jgi:hypothetical protein